jgi:hypothetical protein
VSRRERFETIEKAKLKALHAQLLPLR